MENMIPELTLEPKTAVAADVPQLTLEPSAPAQPEKPAVEPVKIDDSMLNEAEKKAAEQSVAHLWNIGKVITSERGE